MLRLYGDLAVRAARHAARSWLAALAIPVLGFVVAGSLILAGPLGLLGGFLVGLVSAACVASYLTALTAAVAGNKIRLVDFKLTSASFFSVISVMFALWIINWGVQFMAERSGSNGLAVKGVLGLAIAIFFNAVPELIYNSRNQSFTLLKESALFVTEKPFAWFAPNLIFALAWLAATGSLQVSSPAELALSIASLARPSALLGAADTRDLWLAPLLVAFFHYIMVFRGLLYQELTSGGSRMREFRRKMS